MQRKWCIMRKITYGIVMILLTCFLCAFPLQAERTGSITVQIGEKGVSVALYQVADSNFNYINGFDSAGVQLDHISDSDLPKSLEKVITEKTKCQVDVSNEAGQSVFFHLAKGVYLIRQDNSESESKSFETFLVTIPMKQNGEWKYDISASPKMGEIPKTEESSQADSSSKTENPLIPGDTAQESETIEENGVETENSITSVKSKINKASERNDKSGNTSNDSKKIGNKERLPQTGQLIWPIPVLAFLGLCFVIIGKKLHEK